MYGYYGFDWMYLLILLSAGLCAIASWRVNAVYKKYAKVPSQTGMTGAACAERLLQMNGIHDVAVQHVAGNLTDHYNSRDKTLSLSDATYASASVAAVAVAAHECGHAIQDHTGYAPLNIRSAIVPVANFGNRLGVILIMIGLYFSTFPQLLNIGIIFFSATVLFHVVTLPVEFDASHRAIIALENCGVLTAEENRLSRKVLGAAAMTYVASALTAILQLLRYILIARNRRRD